MTRSSRSSFLGRALAGLAAALSTTGALALPGIQWEYTGSIQMMGVQMPVATVRVCRKPGGELMPVDDRCKYSDVKSEAGKTRLRVSCGAPDPMSGESEITRRGETISSVTRLKSAEGEMVMTQTGHKLGPCELPE